MHNAYRENCVYVQWFSILRYILPPDCYVLSDKDRCTRKFVSGNSSLLRVRLLWTYPSSVYFDWLYTYLVRALYYLKKDHKNLLYFNFGSGLTPTKALHVLVLIKFFTVNIMENSHRIVFQMKYYKWDQFLFIRRYTTKR